VSGHIPLIGLTAYPRVTDVFPDTPTRIHTANRYFVDSVVRAGGLPVIIPILAPELAATAIAAVDGLVLTGGGDVDPSEYGEQPVPEVSNVDPARDAWELAFAREAVAQRVPLLAVCRGAQVLNVALGGSLVQDVPTVTGERHAWGSRFTEVVHGVRLEPACRLAAILGTTEVGANSLHHQAAQRLGAGVTAVGWAPDGTVEALEVQGHPEVVAVQWHPELMEHDAAQQGLFRHLIAMASVSSASRVG